MGFANPGALLLSPLLFVLVLLYLWERHRSRLDVPSLLLWESVPDAVVNRSRFQPDPLFFLQLAVLSALILGLADPFFGFDQTTDQRDRRIIILDTSASMQTQEGPETRFEQAKRAIGAQISTLGPAAEVMLVSAANRPNVDLPFTNDRALLAAALERVKPLDTGTNLDGAIALAVRTAAASEVPTRIDLYTDLPAQRLPPRGRDRINIWPLGETDSNLAIESLRVFQGSFQSPTEARASISVRNHSAHEAHGSLTISVADQVASQQLFTIAPRATREFSATGFAHGGLLRARLDSVDALAVDNNALAWLRTPHRLRAVLVSAPSSLQKELETIAAGGGVFDLTTQSPAEYLANPADAELIIFHRFVPADLPNRPSLFIFPDTDTGPFAAHGEISNAEILPGTASHPAMNGLQLRNPFPLIRTKLLRVPDWADPLLQSHNADQNIALVFAGTRDNQRISVLAFDLEAEGLLATDHEGLLLLFLNVLDWLGSDENPVRIGRTGDVVTSTATDTALEIIDPRQRAIRPNTQSAVEALVAGQYRLRFPEGEALFLANFSDTDESAIGRERSSPHLTAAAQNDQTASVAKSGVGRFILFAAAALLLFEWVAARREA